MQEKEKFERYNLLTKVFTPTAPIVDKDLFTGREAQVAGILATITTPGEHAILYGERGIGKSSLANVIPIFLNEQTVFCAQEGTVTRVICTQDDTFKTLWERTLKQKFFAQELIKNKIGFLQDQEKSTQSISLDQLLDFSEDITPGALTDLLGKFRDLPFLFVFDEFDAIQDDEIKRRFAEVIKILSDQSSSATILLVGIGETVTDLIGEHASIERCMRQIRLHRMTDEELIEIIDKGMSRLEIEVEKKAKDLILYISNGLAYFTHLLCRFSAEDIIWQSGQSLGEPELMRGLSHSIANAQESLRSLYYNATIDNKNDDLYKKVLIACAHVLREDEYGAFQIVDVQDAFTRKNNQEISTDQLRHRILSLCEQQRNCVLKRRGTKRNYRYKFRSPLFKAYVLLNEVLESSRSN